MGMQLFPVPSEILAHLDQSIMGQDLAKRKIAGAAYEHYISHSAKVCGVTEHSPRSNLLLFGPTGCGKTLLAHTLARFLGLPFVQVDLTRFASTGYVGEDIGSIVEKLLQAHPNKKQAGKAVLFLDEFDKIAGRGFRDKDVSGFALQAELLKMMEGDIYTWTNRHGTEFKFDLSGVFFIFAGAFPELPQIIRKRLGTEAIGFPEGGPHKKTEIPEKKLLSHAIPEDFDRFGFLPEIMGRMRHFAPLEPLGEEELERVLLEAKGSPLKETQRFFKLHGINLQLSKKAIQAISKKALAQDTGARALASILGGSLEDLRFHCPELQEKGVYSIQVQDFGKDGFPQVLVKEGVPKGLRKRRSLQSQILLSNPSKSPRKKQKAEDPSNQEEEWTEMVEEVLGKAFGDDGLNADQRRRKKKRGKLWEECQKKMRQKKEKKEEPPRSEEEEKEERKEVQNLLFEQIKEDERAPDYKIPKVSTSELISWFMKLYDQQGRGPFEHILKLVKSRGATLSTFHQMSVQSEGKELGTILKFWDYWDALEMEKDSSPEDELPF